MARLSLRVDLGAAGAIGPGKMRLLETIAATGSISAAGRALGMSYRRAWSLVDEMNACFRQPVVSVAIGGKAGGGATLTPLGREVVRRYRSRGAAAPDRHAGGQERLAGASRIERVRRLVALAAADAEAVAVDGDRF